MPEGEVNPGNLNVGFGEVGYQGVKESGAAHIRRGGLRETDAHTRKFPLIYNFLANFQADKLVIKTTYKSTI